ncbi:hypothetical protein E3A20_05030 [Planctomyces bekefii]|uniref:Uncharacterized protein n=1 Tax=Planctomyces bekefii TaxID=1653850 RepID=A0A5C6MAV2_9PLAN|nr:hypothetical protein E3A20_05030 [Planctomyces bekefii]
MWNYDNRFWTIMPNQGGTYLYRLDSSAWTQVLKVSTSTVGFADVFPAGNLVHALLYVNNVSYLVHLEYVPGSPGGYKPWSLVPGVQTVYLDKGVETATIAKDSKERLWIVSDISSVIVARWAAKPYKTWSAPFVVASGVGSLDIASVVTLPNQSIGVFWSNQIKKRFGFRVRKDSAAPTTWLAAEVPADAAALPVGAGMADSHFHLTVTPDGTVLAAVKTKYGVFPQTQIGLLVRRPVGGWDPKLYPIDTKGVNPVVNYASDTDTVRVLYSAARPPSDILFTESSLGNISFSAPRTAFQGPWVSPSISKNPTPNESVAIASRGPSVGSIWMKSRKDTQSPFFFSLVPGETPEATTTRLQQMIDAASLAQVGVYLQRGAIFETTQSIKIAAPGPLYIDGANATLKKVQGTDPIIVVESAQDGFFVDNLRFVGANGSRVDHPETCTTDWPASFASSAIVIHRGRWVTLKRLSIQNTSGPAILVEPKGGDISNLKITQVGLKESEEGIRLAGSAQRPIQNVEILASTVFYARSKSFAAAYAQDVTWRGGSLEKSLGDHISITDSQRLAFYTYSENYGGWIYTATTPNMVWCPRSSGATAVRLSNTTDFFFRGRTEGETDRGGAGPLVVAIPNSCYAISNKGKTLATAICPSGSITPPTPIVTEYDAVAPDHPDNANEIVILPTDLPADVTAKVKEAATKRLGIALVKGESYNWPMMEFKGNADTPAYVDGRGATIHLTQTAGAPPYEAALKIFNPTNWIGRDRFQIKRLTINGNGIAKYGILVQGGQRFEIDEVQISNVSLSAIRAEGKPGSGLYYNVFSNITAQSVGTGLEILSTINSKYANANTILNFRTLKSPTTFAFHWTSSTVGSKVEGNWNGLPAGKTPLLIDTSFSSDIELNQVTTVDAPLGPALIKLGNTVQGINYTP